MMMEIMPAIFWAGTGSLHYELLFLCSWQVKLDLSFYASFITFIILYGYLFNVSFLLKQWFMTEINFASQGTF